MPIQSANALPSLEALLREKDARIAELTTDKAHLYHLLTEAQASLAREQALRSSQEARPDPRPFAVAPEPPLEMPAGVTPFKFLSDEARPPSELPVKADTTPAADPPEGVAAMELFKFVAVDGDPAPPTVTPTEEACPEAPLLTSQAAPEKAVKTPPSKEKQKKDKQEPAWRRLFGKIMD